MDNRTIDKYKVVKIRLSKIIKDSKSVCIIDDAVNRTHQLVIHVYHFLRLWILNKYENKLVIPEITEGILKMAFRALNDHTFGPKPKGDNLTIYNEFEAFYKDTYSTLSYTVKIKGTNLSSIIDYQCTDMLTNIENNIKMHFADYLKQYVNGNFKEEHSTILEKYNGKEKILMNKLLRKELTLVKNDLLKNTLSSDEKYHTWIIDTRSKIYPSNITELDMGDLKDNPQKYMNGMIFMNIKLEEIGKKMFQFFPLRSNIIPKYATFDTKSIIELLVESNKQEYLIDIDNTKKSIWDKYFKMGHPVFKYKDHSFDYMIRTDGHAVSIQFIHNDQYIKKREKDGKMKKGRQEAKELFSKLRSEYETDFILKFHKRIETNDLTKDELDNIEDEYNNISIRASDEASKKISEIKKKKKEDLKDNQKAERKAFTDKNKNLSKEDKKKIIESKKKRDEFPYLEDLSETELDEIKNAFKLYVDPGKKSLLTIMGDDNRIFKYTNSRRLTETKRLKHQRLLHNYRQKEGILESEKILSKCNSKSCKYIEFKKYVGIKNRLNLKLLDKYRDDRFRQYKWHAYINTKRHESKMLDDIEDFFGIKNGLKDNKKVVMIYGDWSVSKQLRNFMPTPMIGLKRKVNERFTIYNIDEFRTSCLDYQTETKCDNLYSPDKKGKIRMIHAVLTFKMKNKRMGCRNRDVNSVMNMKKLTDHLLATKERIEKYSRTYKFEDEIKGVNPSSNKVEEPNSSKPIKVQKTTQGAFTVLKMDQPTKAKTRNKKVIEKPKKSSNQSLNKLDDLNVTQPKKAKLISKKVVDKTKKPSVRKSKKEL